MKPASDRPRRPHFWELKWVCLAFGVLFGGIAWLAGAVGRAGKSEVARYVPVEAEILESRLEANRGNERRSNRDHAQSVSVIPAPRIHYRYQVEGKTYESYRYAISEVFSSKRASRAVRENPAGAIVTAYHDPDNPSLAVLSREDEAWGFRTVAVACFCGVSVLMFVIAINRFVLRQ